MNMKSVLFKYDQLSLVIIRNMISNRIEIIIVFLKNVRIKLKTVGIVFVDNHVS